MCTGVLPAQQLCEKTNTPTQLRLNVFLSSPLFCSPLPEAADGAFVLSVHLVFARCTFFNEEEEEREGVSFNLTEEVSLAQCWDWYFRWLMKLL